MATAAENSGVNSPTDEDLERARQKREALLIKDWRKARPRFEDSPLEREAWEMGEAWRENQTEP